MDASHPFDRARRRRVRGRASPASFLAEWIADEAVARLVEAPRAGALLWCGPGSSGRAGRLADFAVTLDLGGPTKGAVRVTGDEEALPFAPASFDLIVSVAGLHAVNDLPGALIQLRRSLKPGGRLLAGLPGGATLAAERALFVAADAELTGRVPPRFAPMVDTQAAAGLLQRAGFTEPVSDRDRLRARYPSLATLFAELRAAGETGVLATRAPLRRDVLAHAAAGFAARAEVDGRTTVDIEVVWLSGRATA